MKAILFLKYGPPDVLQLTEVEKPTPNEDQILVKVIAAAANPLDWHRMRGAPFLARMGEGLRNPENLKLGADIAGRVEAVGKMSTSSSLEMKCSGPWARVDLPSMCVRVRKISP